MAKLTRAKIAAYFADEIIAGKADVTNRLAALLIDEGRVRELNLIVADIEYELAHRGIVVADVITALPTKTDLESLIRSSFKLASEDQVVVRTHTDPTLIGGIKLRAAGRELDATVRHKLNTMKGAI